MITDNFRNILENFDCTNYSSEPKNVNVKDVIYPLGITNTYYKQKLYICVNVKETNKSTNKMLKILLVTEDLTEKLCW